MSIAMQQFRNLRRMLGALVACLLMSLVFAPAVEAMTCVGEGTIAGSTVVVNNGAGDTDSAPQSDKDGVCQHGHCHHSGQFVDSTIFSAAQPLDANVTVAAPADGVTGWRFYRIDNPPRA